MGSTLVVKNVNQQVSRLQLKKFVKKILQDFKLYCEQREERP